MARPSEVPPAGVRDLADAEAPDWIEAQKVALLAFLDPAEEVSRKARARLELVAARLARPGFGVGVVDVGTYRLVAAALGVKAVPCLVVFAGGEVVDRLMGAPPERVIEDVLAPRLRGLDG